MLPALFRSSQRRTLTCSRTSRKVVVACGGEISGVTRMTSVETVAAGQRLGYKQVLQRKDVRGRLHGRGGHALLNRLPVDHGERLDLHDVESAAALEPDHGRFQVGQLAAGLRPQQRVVIHGGRLVRVPGGAQQQRACPRVADVTAGITAGLFQVAI
jgi:hypothetical protein